MLLDSLSFGGLGEAVAEEVVVLPLAFLDMIKGAEFCSKIVS